MPEFKWNILNFGYGVHFKHEEMLSHSFDKFYVVAKFELPKIEDLHLTTFQFASRCRYIDLGKHQKNSPVSYLSNPLAYCKKIVPYVEFYKK